MATIGVNAYHPDTLELIGTWDSYKFLQVRREINKPGYYQLIFDHNDEQFDGLVLDSILEFRRQVDGDNYPEFWAFHRTKVKAQFSTGLGQYSSFGRGTMDLINRRIVAKHAGVPLETGGICGSMAVDIPADIACYRYVHQHAADYALISNERVTDGVTPNLYLDYSDGSVIGNAELYSGENAWRNLLVVIQEISAVTHELDGTPYEFDMQYDFATNRHTFVLHEGGIGDDRSEGNPSNNKPIIFSTAMGNIEDIWVSYTRSEEVNRIFALGEGEGAARSMTVASSSDKIPLQFGGTNENDTSIYNLLEASRSATGESTTAELLSTAASHLWKNKAEPNATFLPIQSGQSRYGRDYFLGDRITVKHEDFSVDLRIQAVELLYDADGNESVKLEFAERPGQISASYYSVNPDDTLSTVEGDIELMYDILKAQEDRDDKSKSH